MRDTNMFSNGYIIMNTEIKTLFGKNLKFLRDQRNLTQAKLATEFSGVDHRIHKRIGSYEQGKSFPSPELMQNILEYFGVKYEHIVNEDLEERGVEYLETLKKQDSNRLKVLTISVDSDDREKIEMIPMKAVAGYVRGYMNEEYIKQLDKFHLPWLPPEHTYRAFEINGDSMAPIQSGSVVLGKYVEDKQGIKNGERYIIVSKDDILFKRVYAPTQAKSRDALLLTSDNPKFSPYEIALEDVTEVWQLYAHFSMSHEK